MFTTAIKKFQQKKCSQTWQQSLRDKAVVKNSYQTHGDIKKAKAFVDMVSQYSFAPINLSENEQIIFSADMAIAPAYTI